MLRMSFPSLATRSFPGPKPGKQALIVAVAVSFLAACGGSAKRYSVVEGRGYSFEAPVGWTLVHTPRAVGMQHGSVDLVQATRLPLARRYRPALFQRVVPELDRTVSALAADAGATLARRETKTVLGQRVRQYELQFPGHVEELTFVLRGKTNYQLLCRRDAGADDAACERLVESFRID
jgi:hypothetical protein